MCYIVLDILKNAHTNRRLNYHQIQCFVFDFIALFTSQNIVNHTESTDVSTQNVVFIFKWWIIAKFFLKSYELATVKRV